MDIRLKFYLLLYFVIPVGTIGFFLLALKYEFFVFIIILHAIVNCILILKIKCPKCGHHISENKICFGELEFYIKMPILPSKCHHCGYNYNKKSHMQE